MKKNLLLILTILNLNFSKTNSEKTAEEKQPKKTTKEVVLISKKDIFIEALNAKKKSILMLSSNSCHYCQLIKPQFYKLSKEFKKIDFYYIDCSSMDIVSIVENKLKTSTNKKVKNIQFVGYPTFLFIKNKNIENLIIGADLGKLETELRNFNKKISC